MEAPEADADDPDFNDDEEEGGRRKPRRATNAASVNGRGGKKEKTARGSTGSIPNTTLGHASGGAHAQPQLAHKPVVAAAPFGNASVPLAAQLFAQMLAQGSLPSVPQGNPQWNNAALMAHATQLKQQQIQQASLPATTLQSLTALQALQATVASVPSAAPAQIPDNLPVPVAAPPPEAKPETISKTATPPPEEPVA